ncbi:MAG TPA: phospholipase A [Burkholderiales bacterium]|nr:phospholipase A [Burkholderiales bacterium]
MRPLGFVLLLILLRAAQAADWVIAAPTPRADAGERFEILVIAPPGEAPPDGLRVRILADDAEVDVELKAVAPADGERRTYAATLPASVAGPVTLRLAERPSNALVLVAVRRDALQTLTRPSAGGTEAPLSENEPMYFIAGSRGPTTARFQISFKYRLFDATSGFGQGQPWLTGLYFGYSQNSLWDLSSESEPFRDTSYRPSIFWKWERAVERAIFDGARLGLEHESNGDEGERSRSINVAFVRPEWRWRLGDGASFQFTPKLYAYLDKEENPDIDEYRGYADWRVRYDSGNLWIATAVARVGTSGKGSVQLDLARRTRDIRFGGVSGYLYAQYFNGYGEDILGYNERRRAQFRVGFAIVP